MSMLSERLQVLIDRAQRQRLERIARRRGTSVATLVREAIDRTFPDEVDQRRRAAQSILDAEPMDVPDVAELRSELETIRALGS
jgi:hypothetical protein